MNSFSEALKVSLVNSDYIFPEAEFYGFFIGKGEIIEKESEKLIKISITSLNSFKRLYKICKNCLTDTFNVQFNNEKRLNLGGTGSIFINYQTIDEILKKNKLYLNENKLSPFLKKDPIIFGSFIKGLFLSCGSISVKESLYLGKITFSTDVVSRPRGCITYKKGNLNDILRFVNQKNTRNKELVENGYIRLKEIYRSRIDN